MEVKFDQHFMKDELVLDKIVNVSEVCSEDVIFEIGPGQGDLTKKLLLAGAKKVISCELDENLKEDLEKVSSEFNNFELIFGNGLVLFDEIKFDKLIANIPYSITEPLYKKLLDSTVESIVMLHGFDFYKLVALKDSRWNYFVNAFYDVELIDEVQGHEFTPSAKVLSVIVRLIRKSSEKLSDSDKLFQNLWSKRGRATKNCLIFSLVDGYGMTKKEAKSKVLEMKLSDEVLSCRFELLSNENMMNVLNQI